MIRWIKKAILLCCALFCVAWLDPYRDSVSDGNKKYNDKKYPEAKESYNRAGQYAPGDEDRKKLSFNKGAADYMAGDYQGAEAAYREALQSEDPDVQKKAFYNLGNTYMKMNKTKEAFDSYMNALRIDPQYENAKKNVEYLLKKKEQQKQNDRDQDKKGDDKKDQDKQKDSKSGQKDNEDQKQKGDQGENKNNGDREQKMSREQIKNLLNSMKNKPVKRTRGNSDDKRYLEKDW